MKETPLAKIPQEIILRRTVELWTKGHSRPFHYFPQQKLAVDLLRDSKTKYLLYGGGAGGGKTWTGWEWLVWSCLAYPGVRFFVGRSELKRLRRTSFQTFGKVCRKYGILEGRDFGVNNADNFVKFSNGSQIDLLDLRYLPGDPLFERFGSYEYTGGWIEEAGEVLFGAYDVLKSRIGRQGNDKYGLLAKLLLTCNPKKGYLKRLWYDRWKDGTLPDFMAFVPSLAKDNPNLDSGYIEGLQNLSDKALKARLLFGEWEYENNPHRIIEDRAIKNLTTNLYVRDEGARRYITADIARYGADKFVCWVWRGWELVDVKTMAKGSLSEVVKRIEELRNKWEVQATNVVVDEDGLGGGVVDFSPGYQGFVTNRSVEENYANLGTLCAFKVADRINRGQVLVEDVDEGELEMLCLDMEAIERVPKEPGQPERIIPKDRIKEKLGGRSPDYWDAMKMREFFEVEQVDWSAFADL